MGTGHLLSICNLDILIFSGLAESLANFQQCTTHSTLSIDVSYTVSGSTVQEIFAFWCREGVGDDWVDILELDGLIGTVSFPPCPPRCPLSSQVWLSLSSLLFSPIPLPHNLQPLYLRWFLFRPLTFFHVGCISSYHLATSSFPHPLSCPMMAHTLYLLQPQAMPLAFQGSITS
ncbi:hypothetical protein BKA83DRAFT_4216072 [Pisolithus microcarpus]|nr:hypothetical protein BKA83DRAFT_4216072 [Pisolithus microcarpus]